jgi:hypothetical protein
LAQALQTAQADGPQQFAEAIGVSQHGPTGRGRKPIAGGESVRRA